MTWPISLAPERVGAYMQFVVVEFVHPRYEHFMSGAVIVGGALTVGTL